MLKSIDSIKNYIQSVRLQLIRTQFILDFIRVTFFLIPILFLFIIIESIYYLDSFYRIKAVEIIFILGSTGYSYLILKYLINRNQLFGNMDDEYIARYIGSRSDIISDKILNALQLENNKHIGSNDSSLIESALDRMKEELDNISSDSIKQIISKKLISSFYIMILVIIFIIGLNNSSVIPGSNRFFNPKTEFSVPLPFTLVSMSGNQRVLGGDSINVSIAAIGEIPDSVNFIWKTFEQKKNIKVASQDDVFKKNFMNVNSDIVYWAEFKNRSWFSPWSVIKSSMDTIFVKDRPVIENIEFTIIPPEYSKEKTFIHSGNITDVNTLMGSKVSISAQASKILSRAWLLKNSGRQYLSIDGKRISGDFILSIDEEISYWCLDKNMVANSNPPLYRFSIIDDLAPELIVFVPEREININEKMKIDFSMQVIDDYGISDVWLEYQIIHPDYLQEDTTNYILKLENIDTDLKTQQVDYIWDLIQLGLGPEDEIHYYINVADNNGVLGPSITTSSKFIARYPSLDDLFMDLEKAEDEMELETQDMKMSLEDVQELMEELELDLLKSDEMDWEDVDKVEKAMEKMENIQDQIEDIQDQLEMINEMAENNQMVSPELMDKFSELQDLLSEIMTPEMLEAMEKMQEAMEQMNPEQMLEAMKDFEFDAEAMEEQIDRFMEMFKQAMAEQKMDELVKRLEEMLEEQTDIMEELSDVNSNMDELASRERRQEQDFEKIMDSMDQATSSMQEFSPQSAEDLQNLKDSDLTQETKQELKDARKSMQKNDMQNSMGSGQQAKENLEEMLNQANSIQQSYQDQTVAEMMNLFQRLVQGVLSLSQDQEKMILESNSLKSRSPRLVEMAVRQGDVRNQTNQAIEQLMLLSRKTFHISPKIGRAMGKARTSMDKSIAQYEQRQVSTGRSSQIKAIEGLNEAANLMMSSMDMMQESGSASGFESYMESLSEMSSQQQGLNKQTMQMQMGMGMQNQQGMMQRLQAQQQQLQQALQDLLSENPGEQSGGLGKAKDEMDQVIEDFKRRKIDRQTMDRQEKILSRMLDAQKSMSQRDYSEKRKSKKGESFTYDGPSGLPNDFGERKVLLIEAMEEALEEGHSKEYQKMIKTYFRELQKIENKGGSNE